MKSDISDFEIVDAGPDFDNFVPDFVTLGVGTEIVSAFDRMPFKAVRIRRIMKMNSKIICV